MPNQIAQLIKKHGLWLLVLAFTLPVYAAPQVVGHISFVKGSNAAQQPGAAPRILGNGTEIFQGDNIQTTDRSFVIIEFTDGAKITVRPNSNFSIDHYGAQPGDKSAQLVLHEGGVNTATGNIAKDNPEKFQIKTPTATIKPNSSDAEYAIRVCDKACEQKAKEDAANKERTEQSAVARVVDIKGEVNAKNKADKNAVERPLSLGKPIFNSDTVYSEKDSYALLVFPDGQKITVRADSEMDIKQYNYQVKDKKDQILMRLAVGGLRVLTGTIGKKDHDAFALDTPVATIGIRGTDFDPEIIYGADGQPILQLDSNEGLPTITKDGYTAEVPPGNTGRVSATDEKPEVAPTPVDKPKPPEPAPKTDKTKPDELFKEKTPTEGETSVKSEKGSVSLQSNNSEKPVTVNKNEVGSADAKEEVVRPVGQPADSKTDEHAPNFNPFTGGPSDSGPSDPGSSGGGSTDTGAKDTGIAPDDSNKGPDC